MTKKYPKIVFDGSAKIKGPSLNAIDVLLRDVWNIGLMVDVEKAYLQIAVSPTERDYLRFLWYDDVTKKELEIFIFGATCLQFLLNGVVKMHTEKYAEIDPNFATKILRDMRKGIT